jgi:hypothetical protein
MVQRRFRSFGGRAFPHHYCEMENTDSVQTRANVWATEKIDTQKWPTGLNGDFSSATTTIQHNVELVDPRYQQQHSLSLLFSPYHPTTNAKWFKELED